MRLLVVIHIIVAHRLPSPMVLLAITPLAEMTVSPDSTPNHLDIFLAHLLHILKQLKKGYKHANFSH